MVVVVGDEAPDDLEEGCCCVVPSADGGCVVVWHVYGRRCVERYSTPGRALHEARQYVSEYDAAVRGVDAVDPDLIRVTRCVDRGMMALRRLLVATDQRFEDDH